MNLAGRDTRILILNDNMALMTVSSHEQTTKESRERLECTHDIININLSEALIIAQTLSLGGCCNCPFSAANAEDASRSVIHLLLAARDDCESVTAKWPQLLGSPWTLSTNKLSIS